MADEENTAQIWEVGILGGIAKNAGDVGTSEDVGRVKETGIA